MVQDSKGAASHGTIREAVCLHPGLPERAGCAHRSTHDPSRGMLGITVKTPLYEINKLYKLNAVLIVFIHA